MTIERPMFPPKRDNPFRLVGGIDAIDSPPAKRRGRPTEEIDNGPAASDEPENWRGRARVKRDIDAHIAARQAYQQAVSWLAAAEAENLPIANIEAAREDLRRLHAEMTERARMLLITMPTDPKGLVDLLMYLEKNFTSLPADVVCGGEFGGMPKVESLAFNLLRTMRLSLRAVAKYGKYGPTS